MTRLSDNVTADAPVDERKAAVIGGFVSGALTGLAADIASGGITFGAGLLAGGIVGAVGAAGVARGFNVVRGRTESTIRWSDEFVAALVPPPCCAIWPSRTTDAAAANGSPANIRCSGATP
jgi:hypothetical protein